MTYAATSPGSRLLHPLPWHGMSMSSSGSHATRRWRKTDSNLWSHVQRGQRFRARHSVSRSTAPAAGVLISENDDFAFPVAKVTALAKARASWCIEARAEASQVGRSAPEAAPGNRLETAQQMAAHAKARAHRTLERRNVEGQGGRGGPE
jgi:hypothetical protein